MFLYRFSRKIEINSFSAVNSEKCTFGNIILDFYVVKYYTVLKN